MEIEGFTDVSAVLRSGVYILLHHRAIVYIGKSKSMYSRIYNHRNLWVQSRRGKNSEYPSWLPQSVKGMLFDGVLIRPCPIEALDALEKELIQRYRPKYNIVYKTRERVATEVALNIRGVVLTISAHTKEQFERRV